MDTGKLTTIYESGFAVANELPYEGLVSASCQLILQRYAYCPMVKDVDGNRCS